MEFDWFTSVFGWASDPTAWAGLAMLIVLEIVLGIDNLIFIAILTEKLPKNQQLRARYTGLSMALLMRLFLLATISWIVTLTRPLITILGNEISGRDIVLITGGLFLLLKGTMELHERLEGFNIHKTKQQAHAVFWQVIAQIVVLDAVFSLDSVITAVGMVKHLPVMMLAVIIAVGVMMAAANPLMNFVNRHPTVVILCLGFLLMIGFSLIIEGFGFHVPKGYLYAAIGFSVIIEIFNQIARRNSERSVRSINLRESTARAVLRFLGGDINTGDDTAQENTGNLIENTSHGSVFAPEEREMIRQVIKLGGRNVRAIMVPRPQIMWLDQNDPQESVLKDIDSSAHTTFPVCQDDVDNVIGIVRTRDILLHLAQNGSINLSDIMKEPLFVTENISVVTLIERFKASATHMAIVVDEHGTVEGLVTPADILGAIAGELGEEGDDEPDAVRLDSNCWIMNGQILIDEALRLLDIDTPPPEEGDYSTLAGFILNQTGHIPEVGESIIWEGWTFEVTALDGRRIEKILIKSGSGENE